MVQSDVVMIKKGINWKCLVAGGWWFSHENNLPMTYMVDNNNCKRPVRDKHSLHCRLKFHNDVFIAAFVDGNWAKEPLTDLTMEQKRIHITAFLHMHKEHINILMRDCDQHDVKDSGMARDEHSKKKHTYLLANISDLGWEHLKSMFANLISDIQVIFLVDTPEKVPMVIFFVEKVLDFFICTETRKWYDLKNDPEQKI